MWACGRIKREKLHGKTDMLVCNSTWLPYHGRVPVSKNQTPNYETWAFFERNPVSDAVK